MTKSTKVYGLRCASAERIDFFEAGVVTTNDGSVEIRGGNVRDPYAPHEVYRVTGKAARDIRAAVSEIERAAAEAKAFPSEMLAGGEMVALDVRAARSRDDIEMTLPGKVLALIRQHNLSLFDASLSPAIKIN